MWPNLAILGDPPGTSIYSGFPTVFVFLLQDIFTLLRCASDWWFGAAVYRPDFHRRLCNGLKGACCATINRGFIEGETIELTVNGRSPAPVGRWVNGLTVPLFVFICSAS